MEVAFDEQIFLFQRRGGISRYFMELIRQFDQGGDVHPVLPYRWVVHESAAAELPRHGLRRVPRAAGRPLRVLRRRQRRAGPAGIDLVHRTFYDPRWLDDQPGVPSVITIYDMIPEEFPDAVTPGVHMAKGDHIDRADLILTISESARQDLIRHYGPPAAPVRVTPLGVAPLFFSGGPRPPGLADGYVLYVGNRSGYKDFDVLVRALADVPGRHDLLAVGGGPFTPQERRLLAQCSTIRAEQRDVADRALAGAYAHAGLVVVPSRYEGFGLPVLEAMAAGAPVIAADTAALVEVGGDTITYFAAGNTDALADRIARVRTDGAAQVAATAAARIRAQDFTWARTADLTAAAYREVVEAQR